MEVWNRFTAARSASAAFLRAKWALLRSGGDPGRARSSALPRGGAAPGLAGLAAPFKRTSVTKALMDTEAGSIAIELFEADAPGTVANFVKLANEGFYDGLAFHRVIDGFMAQGGCPNSREGARGQAGTGGPGYMIPCEINKNKHQAGSLSMAHAGKNTGGSQFFLCHGATPHLDGVHTVFGHTGDLDVVLKLRNGSRINKVTIEA